MSLVARRIARLAREGSPRALSRAVARELGLRRAEAALRRALVSERPLVVGPFLGEVGYELLYWRPAVLRLLRDARVDPARVTVISRGGAGAWYEGVAARSVDAFELATTEEVRAAGVARVSGTAQQKQVAVDPFDRELVGRAGLASAALVHPLHVYWRSRFLWEGLRPAEDAAALGDYDDLPRAELDARLAARLPERFVAVKAYFNECVPDEARWRDGWRSAVEALAREAPVVLLEAGAAVDAHADWSAGAEGVTRVGDLLEPATNLAVQAEIAARSRALVATYGGFSYVGPFLGVPTVAVAVRPEDNPRHEQVLRAVRPGARFERRPLRDPAAIAAAARGA